ncbi:MAG: Hpt domain-containing protein, partial [Oscillospiraceae bacterium]
DTCFVVLTANAIHGAKQVYLDAGFDDYLSKPFTGADIEKCLFRHLPQGLCREEKIAAENTKAFEPKPDEPVALFDPVAAAKYLGGDTEAYREILSVYVRKAPEISDRIAEYFSKKDWKNYIIEVHALKSSSLTIGAKPLSELAKELELSGKDGKYDVIEEKNAVLLDLFQKIAAMGNEYLAKTRTTESEKPEQLTEITAESAKDYLSQIMEACRLFDTDKTENLCAGLMGCSVNGEPLSAAVDEIKRAADDFEYEAAAKLAQELTDRL